MSYEFSKAKTPQQIRYFIKCKVVIKEITYDDEQSTGTQRVSDYLAFLIPEESTQRSKFLMAWLPDTDLDCQELACEIGHPIHAMFRAALWRRRDHMNEIHLMVMTKFVEDELKKLNGKTVQVEVLAEDEDELMDHQIDVDMDRKKFDQLDNASVSDILG